MSELWALGGADAAAALASSACSAQELTAAHLRRIAEHNPAINAYLHVDAAGAMQAAVASDERRRGGRALHPLDGVPVAIKDNIAVAGMPWTAGMATRRELIADEDAYCVAKLRRAGAVILGKLHLQEAALGADGDNPHYGACHNPHRLGHSPGGSSSGSAAALAGHLCTLALGSDSMGSVRIPAAYCGVVGLKPSTGRVSQRGLVTASRRLDQIGPMARRVRDLAMLYQQISGVDSHDPASRSVILAHSERAPARLKIGVLADLERHGVEPALAAAFERGVRALDELLPRRVEVRFDDYDFGRLRRAGLLLCEAEMNLVHADDLRERPELFSPTLSAMLAWARGKSAVDLIQADRLLDTAVLKARRLYTTIDVLLTPTTPQVAFAHRTAVPANQADLTSFANFAGIPALSLPLPELVDGLPAGLQLLGPAGSDLQLLALGERIERVFAGALPASR